MRNQIGPRWDSNPQYPDANSDPLSIVHAAVSKDWDNNVLKI